LIHAAIWLQQILAENWELCTFGEGELGPHLTHVALARAEAYLHAKFHVDPSNHMATVHQRHRQSGQQSDITVRTVFGRPFVKRFALCYRSIVYPVCLSCLC